MCPLCALGERQLQGSLSTEGLQRIYTGSVVARSCASPDASCAYYRPRVAGRSVPLLPILLPVRSCACNLRLRHPLPPFCTLRDFTNLPYHCPIALPPFCVLGPAAAGRGATARRHQRPGAVSFVAGLRVHEVERQE